ncbi:hypothetical protein [Streptomyces xanthophaeus]|uniref:hypothetical protein n=1 Tax=Streptomyces xanthophaeus TaxID=67385 RepID=UPI003711844B
MIPVTLVNAICLCGHRDQHTCRADWANRPTPVVDVQGRCPACHWSSLFLADGGYVTCRRLECPDPDAASRALESKETP